MKKELGDFIFGLSEFNDCTFCKKFGLNKDCPTKYLYKEGEENPPAGKIERGFKMCKNYVLMNVNYLAAFNE